MTYIFISIQIILSKSTMDDNYGGSEDDYGNAADEDAVEEGFSDDSEKSQDYEASPEEGAEDLDNLGEQMEEEEESEGQESEEINNYEIIQEEVKDKPNVDRITSPFMTKFQKAKIIGMRAVQISKNAPLYLKSENIANMNWDPITIAEKELAEKKIPFIIRRYLPDASFEDWKLSELKTFD